MAEPGEDRAGAAALRLGPRRSVAGAEPDDDEGDAEENRHGAFDGVVRVEPLDRGLADEQAEPTGDARPEQESTQERDAVRARAVAADDDERRRQHERAGSGDNCVEQDVKAGVGHAGGRDQWGVPRRSTGNDRCGTPHPMSIAIGRRLTTMLFGSNGVRRRTRPSPRDR